MKFLHQLVEVWDVNFDQLACSLHVFVSLSEIVRVEGAEIEVVEQIPSEGVDLVAIKASHEEQSNYGVHSLKVASWELRSERSQAFLQFLNTV